MLIEFSVANFKSIRDRQTFSMVASSGKEMMDSHTFKAPLGGKSDIRLLRSAAIYGANASGKSNFLNAMNTMTLIVKISAAESQFDALLSVTPFLLDPVTRNKPSEFEMVFIVGDVRYQYGFSATRERIVEEWLLAYPHGRAQTWLDREWNEKKKEYDWHLGSALKGEKNLWKNATRENALFLSTAVMLNSRQLLPVHDWLKSISNCDSIRKPAGSVVNFDSNLTSLYCAQGGKENVMNLLQGADLDIHDVQLRRRPFESPHTFPGRPDAVDVAVADLSKAVYGGMGQDTVYEVSMLHKDIEDQLIAFDWYDESDGTRRLYSLSGYWVGSLQLGYVVIVDELHEHLHPKLVRYLVGLFNNEKTNPKNAQLIFATHETSFMDQEILRRDQIWFCEINSKLATEVYPLTGFHPRKGRDNLRSAYLSGSYGALPHIKEARG